MYSLSAEEKMWGGGCTDSSPEAVRGDSPLLGKKMAPNRFKMLERLEFGLLAPTDAGMLHTGNKFADIVSQLSMRVRVLTWWPIRMNRNSLVCREG